MSWALASRGQAVALCITCFFWVLLLSPFSWLCCCWWTWLYFIWFQLINLSCICQSTFYLFLDSSPYPTKGEGSGVSMQLQGTSFPAGLNHGKGQDRAETGMEIFCQGIQDSSMSYGTEASQEISDLFKVLQAVCGKMRRKPQYPKSSKDYLPLKGNFFFHVRLTSHLALWERSLQHSYCWKNSLENNNKKKDVMINSLYLFSAETEKSD